MSAEDKKALAQARKFNAFWPCLLVFGLLACEHAIGLLGLSEQHQQLQQARALQNQNLEALSQAKQMSGELQSLSLDLLGMSQTNAAAKQIVREFGISWTPGTNAPSAAAPAAAPAPTEHK